MSSFAFCRHCFVGAGILFEQYCLPFGRLQPLPCLPPSHTQVASRSIYAILLAGVYKLKGVPVSWRTNQHSFKSRHLQKIPVILEGSRGAFLKCFQLLHSVLQMFRVYITTSGNFHFCANSGTLIPDATAAVASVDRLINVLLFITKKVVVSEYYLVLM